MGGHNMPYFFGYDDYELIYLIREGNDDAMQVMITKYTFLIKKIVRKFNVNSQYREDFVQEGQMTLLQALMKFDESYGKSFFKFFELMVTRRFVTLLRKESMYGKTIDIITNEHEVKQQIVVKEDDYVYRAEKITDNFSDLEKRIYEMFFLKNYAIEDISFELTIDKKMVYNALYRIKLKLKELKTNK